MKKTFFSVFFGVVISAAIFVSAIVFAQDKITALVQPLIVDIQHSVPVLAEVVVPLKDGTTVTATVPLTINVALQVSLSGIVSDSVEVVEKIEPAVVVSELALVSKQGGSVVQEEELIYDELRWTVDSAENAGQGDDSPDSKFEKRETKGMFIIVSFTVENVSNNPKRLRFDWLGPYTISLRDGKDRNFDAYSGNFANCDANDLNPGLPESCMIVFEVPKDSANFSVVFTDEDKEQAIPLGF